MISICRNAWISKYVLHNIFGTENKVCNILIILVLGYSFFFNFMVYGEKSFASNLIVLHNLKHNEIYLYYCSALEDGYCRMCHVWHLQHAYRGNSKHFITLCSVIKNCLRRISMMLFYYIHNEINVKFWDSLKHTFYKIWSTKNLTYIFRATLKNLVILWHMGKKWSKKCNNAAIFSTWFNW